MINLALEVDYLPGHEEWIRELAGAPSVGLFHRLGPLCLGFLGGGQSRAPEQMEGARPFEVWSIYFDWLGQAAETGLFEIIGHADLPKKFKIYPKEDCTPLYDRFLERAAKANVAIELNTAGLRKDCREIYPSRALLEIAAKKKVPITFGSDAHAPGDVGSDFQAAIELAKSVGYTRSCRFTQRRRTDATF